MDAIFGKVGKVDAIWVKILAIEDQFYLKPSLCGEELWDIESLAQELNPVSKDNDFEVLDLKPEIFTDSGKKNDFRRHLCRHW